MTEKRNKIIKIRCTESEYSDLKSRSKKPRLAEWMREHCLDVKPPRSRTMPDVDPALLRQLAGLGNNLNQIARAVNTKDWGAVERVQIVAHLAAIQRQLAAIRADHDS